MSARPKRVLHVVRGMVRAGVETWLMQVLRRIERNRVEMDFLVHLDRDCAYDREIQAWGCRILRCTAPVRSPMYGRRIAEILRDHGPYDAIHSHVHHFSGFVVRAAERALIPRRIAHSHSDTASLDGRAGWLRGMYLGQMKQWIRTYATNWIGASAAAGRSLFGAEWRADRRSRILCCGIDLTPFRAPTDRAAVRAELGISEDDFLIGHVGRFDPPKNQAFLAEIALSMAQRGRRFKMLLVGDGPLRPGIQDRIRYLGLDRSVIFAGVRDDVPRLLRAMDAFVFPSIYEGLGLTLIEAQAAGLPCVISDAIPLEADVVPGFIHRAAIRDGAERWADLIQATAGAPLPPASEAIRLIEASPFQIQHSVEDLYELYAA